MKRDKGSASRPNRLGVGGKVFRPTAIIAATAAVVTATAPSSAQDACEVQRIFASQPAVGDEFGLAVDIFGDVIIVGALKDDDNGFNAGAAYLFRFDGSSWEQEQKISASGGGAIDDHFGISVAVDGTTAIVGASVDGLDVDTGGAYIFELIEGSWVQIQFVGPAAGEAFDQFGWDVDISGDVIVIGVPGAIFQTGVVNTFQLLDGVWIPGGGLAASDGGGGDRFGSSVAVDGDIAVVGSINGPGNVFGSGASYVYRLNGVTWTQAQKMVPFDGFSDDVFGWSVAVSGDVAVVGSPADDDLGPGSGSAYVFRFDGFAYRLQAKLLASDGDPSDAFGFTVGIDGDTVIVGAPNHTHDSTRSGAVYVFRYNHEEASWPQVQEIIPRTADEDDLVGVSVAIHNDHAVFGTPGDDEHGELSGSAYAYAGLDGVDCNTNGVPDACDIFDGTSKDTDDNGIPDECEGVADLDGDGDVDPADLILLLGAWGPCDDCRNCPFDLDGDCLVGTADLIILLGAWGK